MIRRILKSGQSGNVFFAIFGAVALVGILGGSVMTLMKGPLNTSVRLNKINVAENQMAIGAQVAVMATSAQSNAGDCDGDGYVEPIAWRSPVTEPVPTGGGLVPLSLGMSKKDPWGTDYGYCVWNHGSISSANGCDANMLTGTQSHIYPVVALVSAGPDRAFTTTCRSFATADVNADGDLQDVGDLELVSKAAETDDDIIFTYSYEEASGASGGLWNLKSGDPTTAEIAKDIEVTGNTSVGGVGSFTGGVVLPDASLIVCDGSTNGVMARNASGTGIQICDGSGWQTITGSGGSTPSGIMQLEDQTVNTDGMCDGSNIGLMRYNTSGQGDDLSTTIDEDVTTGDTSITYVGTNTGSAGTPTSTGTATVVQATTVATSGASAASRTFSTTPTIGNMVIVSVSSVSTSMDCDVSSSMTVSDNKGNTYTRAVSAAGQHGGAGYVHSDGIWYAPITSSSATFTVTATSSTCNTVSISLMEVSGLSTVSPVDATGSTNSTYATSTTVTTGATTQAAEFAVGVMTDDAGDTITFPAGWTTAATHYSLNTSYKSLSAIGAVSATWTTGSMQYKAAAIATFKIAAVTPALVQETTISGSSAASITKTFSTTPTVGNTAIVILSGPSDGSAIFSPSTFSSITDNKGNTYTLAAASAEPTVGLPPTYSAPNYIHNVLIYSAPITTSSATFTVTATEAGAPNVYKSIKLLEVSGISNVSPVDVTKVTNTAVPYGGPFTLSSTTPTTFPNDFILGVRTQIFGTTAGTISGGWTQLSMASGDFSPIYQVQSAIGTFSNTWSGMSNDYFVGALVAFKPAGGITAGSQSVALAVPGGTTTGDLLVYAVSSDEGTSGDITWPAGFTELTSQNVTAPDGQSWAVAYKISDGTEVTLTVTDATTYGMVASLSAYRGAHATTPISAYSVNTDSTTTSSPWTLTGTTITPTANGSKLVFIGSADPDSTASGTTGGTLSSAPPSGFTERVDLQGTNTYSGQAYLTVADKDQTTAAATGSITSTLTSSAGGTARTGAVLLAISPSGSTVSSSGTTSIGSYNSHVEVCNGSEWVVVGRGSLNDMADARTEYAGAATSDSSQSTYSMFLGLGSGDAATTGATNNTALGYNTLNALTTGTDNTALGANALYTVGTGNYNAALGSGALYTNTGSSNTALGYRALYTNGASPGSSAMGYQALYNNTGASNTGIGYQALYSNVAKTGSTAVGYQAMAYTDNTATSSIAANTAAGYQAMLGQFASPSSVTGTNNVAIGYGARTISTGGNDVHFGSLAGATAWGSSGDVGVGYRAGYTNSGTYNTYLGANALYSQGGNLESTAIGYNAMYNADSRTVGLYVTYNTAVGYEALKMSGTPASNTGTYNTAFGGLASGGAVQTTTSYTSCLGYRSCYAATGNNTTAVGTQALPSSTGANNTAMGRAALAANTVGTDNVAVGTSALLSSIAYSGATAVGFQAMSNMHASAVATTSYNTAVGSFAMGGSATPANNTGTYNTAIGAYAMAAVSSGMHNVAVGSDAMRNMDAGGYNAAVGYRALYTSSASNYSIAVGTEALYTVNSADGNTAIGYQALRSANAAGNVGIGYQAGYAGTAITSGTNNTFVGYQAQANANNYTNGMALGNGAVLTASNRIVLGNASISTIYGQVTSITGISDRRHKKDITDDDLGLAFINTLHPVSYRFNNGDETLRYGFIAQEIEQALPDKLKSLVHQNENGLALLTVEANAEKTYRVNYGEFFAPLIRAVQELGKKVDVLSFKLDTFVEDTKVKFATLFDKNASLKQQVAERAVRIQELKDRAARLKNICDHNNEIGMGAQ